MSNLLLSTLAMMGMTFIIGFFVAGVIKIIANWADFLDFYQLHREELLNIKKVHKLQHHTILSENASLQRGKAFQGEYRKLSHRVNDTINNLKPRKRVTA